VDDVTDDWMEDAACRGMDSNIWFPIQGGDLKGPRAICATCPVTDPCLEKALHDEPRPTGIWGGTTERQRRDMRTALGIRSSMARKREAS
jgi:WhiB family redox-sensing transcriptional regulator